MSNDVEQQMTSSSPIHRGTLNSRAEIDDVQVFDTTLRDGEQSPGVSFTYDEKREIAALLDEMDTHVIEGGFPINSEREFEAVRDIAEATTSTTCALARVVEQDVEAALETGVDLVLVFVSTSDVQLEDSMHCSREDVKDRAVQSVRRVKEAGADVMFAPMDATRTDEEFLEDVLKTVSEIGPDWIAIPDTCGVATPSRFHDLIAKIDRWTDAPVDVHTQDDFGLATANALAGLEAGAARAQVTVNGIGERGGNAAYETVVMALESLYNVDTGIDTSRITELCRLIEEKSDISIPANKPVVGSNAFSHESGIHTAGVIENADTFEPGVMTPEMVGAKRELVLGKHSGENLVREQLQEVGYEPDEEAVQKITRRVKARGVEKNRVSLDMLEEIAENVGV
jgi:2-isopropylmalate synthase